MYRIYSLTPEELESLIAKSQKEWQYLVNSTEAIDTKKAEAAVKNVYAVMKKKAPKIVFVRSPKEALKLKQNNYLLQALQKLWKNRNKVPEKLVRLELLIFILIIIAISLLGFTLVEKFGILGGIVFTICGIYLSVFLLIIASSIIEVILQDYHLKNSAIFKLEKKIRDSLFKIELFSSQTQGIYLNTIRSYLENLYLFKTPAELIVNPQLSGKILEEISYFRVFPNKYSNSTFIFSDLADSSLNLPINQKKWQAYQEVVRECGSIFAWNNNCVICDRPRKISLDNSNLIHAEGEPAIEFADGFKIYAFHGVIFPEKYGKIKPKFWSSQWLLSEQNPELIIVLIQGIGYDRIYREFPVTEIKDTDWEEYCLIKIDRGLNIKPIHLLTATYPNTGKTSATLVPSHIEDIGSGFFHARVNQGIMSIDKGYRWDLYPENLASKT